MTNDNKKMIRLGARWGIWGFILIVPVWIVYIFEYLYPEVTILFWVENLLQMAAIVLYSLLLLGIRAIAMDRNDVVLAKNAWTCVLVGGLMSLIFLVGGIVIEFAPISLAVANSVGLAYLVGIGLIVWLGIICLRFSKDFARMEPEFGVHAIKASKWNKIGGWLIVSVILFPIGALLSLIADYHMWKILKQDTSK